MFTHLFKPGQEEEGVPESFVLSPVNIFFKNLFIYPCCVAFGILVPQSGIEPWLLAVEGRILNH